MPRTCIIGDVHGLLGPLEALVETLALGAGDHLIFVGDLVDKGPDSAGVVRFVRGLSEDAPFQVTLIEGNHEDSHRRYYINLTKRPKVAREQAARASRFARLDAELSSDDRAFLASAVPFHRLSEWKILVVHGGITGDKQSLPATLEEAAALTGKRRASFRTLLRTRYIDKDTGVFLALDREKPGDPFWADVYDGRFGHVVFGHQPFMGGPACFAYATGIDTAAVHGGALTALVLEEGKAPCFISVPGEEHKPFRAHKAPLLQNVYDSPQIRFANEAN